MGKNIKERNQLADFARVFMAFIVVAIHVNIFYEHPALNKITVDGFFRIAVPFFLMINGYYFHENISHVESFKKWLKRGIVLFFVWQAIYLPLYLPIEDLSYNRLAVFLSQLIFGYHHLWYISAMVLGGIILFALRDKPYSLALSLFLFIIGCCLQYVRPFIDNNPTLYKVFSQYWLFRNGLFFGFPMMYIGFYIAKNNLLIKFNNNLLFLFLSISTILYGCEIFFVQNIFFSHMSYHIDFLLSILLLTPVVFIFIMRTKFYPFKDKDTKYLALFSSIVYFIHPYVIKLIESFLSIESVMFYINVLVISSLISFFCVLNRKRLWFLF
ncbi:TPA: acyltransferase [Klebsiella pneumoniae]|nr:acyltransferase [Klebsiella pneumoniae]